MARLLDDFGAPAVIDYLSLDIEGAEWYAFSTFPWHRYVFLTITVERPATELRNKLMEVSSTFIALLAMHERATYLRTLHALSPFMRLQEGYKYLCDHSTFGDELFVHESIENYGAIKEKFGGREQCRS